MENNIGTTDRAIRIFFGLAFIISGIAVGSWWGAVGIIPLATATIGWCPAYVPFGISTCKKSKSSVRSPAPGV